MTQTVGRKYSGQSADERRANRRARLIEAAHELFGTRGYSATPIDRLCSVAKVSTRHFYEEFDNKEAALLAVHASVLDEAIAATKATLADMQDIDDMNERMRRSLGAYLGVMMADPRNAQIAFVEVVGTSPAIESQRLGYREDVVSLISFEGRDEVGRGETTLEALRFVGLALSGSINAIVYDWSLQEERVSAEELIEQIAALGVRLIEHAKAQGGRA